MLRINARLLIIQHNVIDTLTVVVIVKSEEIVGTAAIFRLHLAAVFHIIAQQVDQFIIVVADLAKRHCVIMERALFIVLRDVVVMQVYQRLAHISKVKLNT